MARVMICDDDKALAKELLVALRTAGHEATTCHHTMDVLREAAEGRFDLVVFGLDMPGFGGARAIEAIKELAPQVPLIGLHKRPSEIMRSPAQSRLAAILPRPVALSTFMYAVARALEFGMRSPSAQTF
jgi:two-component system, NtrC family, nitrogen regulation response regulator NtrX